MQYFRYAKSKVAETERRERGAEYSLARFLAKNARTERQSEAHAQPLPPDASQTLAEKRAYIEAAVERSKQKKELLQKDKTDDD